MRHLAADHKNGFWWQIGLEAVPALSVFVLLLFAMIPVRLPSAWSPGGLWPLAGLFYWLLVQPRLMPVLVVFVIGLLCDLALNMPLGCYALCFILLHVILTTQRRFLVGQGFWLIWPAFILSLLGVYSMAFGICDLVRVGETQSNAWRDGLPAIITVGLAFPMLLPFFHGLQRLIERMT